MDDQLFITASVIIRNNQVLRDEEVVFDYQGDEDFLMAAYTALDNDYPKFFKMDVLGKSGIIGVHELLKGTGVPENYQPDELGIVFSNRSSSLDADRHYLETASTFPSPALFVYTLPNIVIGEISIRYHCKGENAFFISERFDADWLHFYVNDLMKRRLLGTCICGWLEADGEKLDICLFLVEKNQKENAVTFTQEELKKIYYLKSGV